jgi:hypothetical protein
MPNLFEIIDFFKEKKFALWAKIGIFLKILNFDLCQFAEPLNPTLHGVIEYGPWAFQEY